MSTFAERARASVAPLSPADRDDWITFQARNHGVLARQADPAWLRWLEANPNGDAPSLQAWICRRKGAIVGSQGGIPFRLKEGDQIQSASWAVDLMVEPEWRLHGLGPALTDAQARGNGFVAALSISQAAYRAYLRSGWRDLGDVPNYVHPRDIGWSVAQAGLHGARGAAARAIIRLALTTTRHGSSLAIRMMGTKLRRIERFDEHVDRVWVVAGREYGVIAARDHRTLAWRFDAVPDADRMTRYYLMQRGRVRGYVVTRLETWRDTKMLAIVDYLAAPRWVIPLLAHVIALDEARDVAAVTCRTLDPRSALAFAAIGFIRVAADDRPGPLNRSASTPVRFMIYQGDQPERLAFDRDQWFLTAGDSDIGLGSDEGI